MGNKIITEKDFWKCDGGLIPTQFQSTQQVAKTKSGERYITQSDTATVSFADFSCTKLMLIMAILTALIAVAVVATGGAALIAIGAVAGAAGAVAGAVVGSLLCGQMVAKVRKWIGGKQNFKIQGIPTITGNHTMLCPLFGSVISIDTQTKTWGQALAQGGAKFIEGVMQGMLLGALTGIGGAVFGGVRTALTSNQTIGQLGLQFIKTAPQNVINNFGQGFTNGTAFKLLDGLTNWLKTYGDKGEATLEDFKEGVSESTFGDVNAVKSVLTTGGTYQDWIAVAMLFTPAGGKGKNALQNNITDTPNSKKTDTDTSNNKKTDENPSVKKNNINFEAENKPQNGEAYAEGGDALILKTGDKYPKWKGSVDYSGIKNPRNPGRKAFTKKQKEQIYEKNREVNGGYLVSDLDGTILEPPKKSQKGITPSKYEAQVDHKKAKSKGGENTSKNAQVLSRKQNRDKWNK